MKCPRSTSSSTTSCPPSHYQIASRSIPPLLGHEPSWRGRAPSGDDSAFTSLVRRFHPAVFRWALMLASDPDEAEDITQEVFGRTYRQLDQYRSDGPLDAWLYRMTRRAATQMRRTCKRRSRLALSPAAQPLRDVYTTDPGGRVDRERAATLIRERFSTLSRRQPV